MKKFNFIYGVAVASTMLLASCSNDQPEFNDADAFVAFTNTSLSVDEFGASIDVPVLLTSLAGLDGSAIIEVDTTSTAKEGEHYTLPESNVLIFTKEAPTQNYTIKVIDNDDFGGDKKLVLNIVEVTGANMGAVSQCVITIADNEHPLQAILGTYTNKYVSYYDGELEATVSITKDDEDVEKVWIYPIVAAVPANKVYGIVNAEKTEIAIPVGQALGKTSSYNVILDAEDENGELSSGQNIIAKIQPDGSIVIDEYIYIAGAYYIDGGGLAGYYDVILSSVWTKQ